MTVTQARKTANGAKPRAKAAPKSAARRPAARSRSHSTEIPGWAATIASVVGVGVAVGVGLYATRRQWLPAAEQWGESLNGKVNDLRDKYGHHASNDHRDDDIDADEWDDDIGLSDASYPASRPAA